jgi:hypothetical protein
MWWLAGALILFVLAAVADRARTFRDRFPALTDAEFLALCPPGTNPAVALKVRAMCAEYFAVDYERVHPSMTFVEDL